MSKKNIFLALQNGFWFIEQSAAFSLGETVQKVLSGSFWKELDRSDEKSILENTILLIGASKDPYLASNTKLSNATPDSLAIITIDGPIMKHDNCGDPGTKTFESLIKTAAENPNIAAIILSIDSPGGTVDGTQSLANVIKSVEKPVVSFVDGMMASAAYWIGSPSAHIIANASTNQIGSIGTMISFADMQPLWEKAGVKFHNVNADESVDKNAAFMELRSGNYDRIRKESLNPMNDQFVAAVKENRAGKFDVSKENIFTGKVYIASDAVKHGLIDSIGNLNQAIDKAFELAGIKPKNQSKTNMKIKIAAFTSIVLALAGAGFEKPEALEELSEDHLKALESKLTADDTQATKLQERITALENEAAADKTKITSLEADLKAAKKEFTDFKASNPGLTATKAEGAEKTEASADDEFLTSVDKEKQALRDKGII